MSHLISFVVFIIMTVTSSPVSAYIEIKGSKEFRQQVEAYLEQGMKISHHIRLLIEKVNDSPLKISIRPLTDNPDTWHRGGDATRSHTKAKKRKSEITGIRQISQAAIYINPSRILRSDKTYSHGTLIHEFVHALDMVSNRYHEDHVIREKRAVFFQNIWREAHGRRLRKHYHKKFETREYQQALEKNQVSEVVDYMFNHDDLPSMRDM